jgi:hypothetical protein
MCVHNIVEPGTFPFDTLRLFYFVMTMLSGASHRLAPDTLGLTPLAQHVVQCGISRQA